MVYTEFGLFEHITHSSAGPHCKQGVQDQLKINNVIAMGAANSFHGTLYTDQKDTHLGNIWNIGEMRSFSSYQFNFWQALGVVVHVMSPEILSDFVNWLVDWLGRSFTSCMLVVVWDAHVKDMG